MTMFSPVSCEIVRKTSLMSASFRSSEIGSPVNWDWASEIVRERYWLLAGAVCSWSRAAAAASKRASPRFDFDEVRAGFAAGTGAGRAAGGAHKRRARSSWNSAS